MSARTSLEKAVDDFHKSDVEYKSNLLRYSTYLLSSELAIIGFLLQNDSTRRLLNTHNLKEIYLLAVCFSAAVVVLYLILKKYERLYEKSNMHIHISGVIVNGPVEVFGKMVKLETDQVETLQAKKNLVRYDRITKLLLRSAEISFAVASILGAVFAGGLVLSI